MKTKDVAKQYGFDVDAFDTFCMREPTIQVGGAFSNTIPDYDVKRIVEMYKKKLEYDKLTPEQKAAEKAEKERKERERQQAIASMLVTSGFNFDGYKIKKYSGYISGDDAVQINRNDLFVNAGQNLTDALVVIRIQALKELKEAAYDLGCNAVIGVDFDYISFEPQTANASGGTTYQPYVICVTANGNAVVIEKE